MDATVHFPTLINVLGHVAGICAFGAFLFLLLRGVRDLSAEARWAPGAAAALALAWNVGSLAVQIIGPGGRAGEVVASLSFAVLSLLPGVLLHLALGAEHRAVRLAGYLLSGTAAAAHLAEASGIDILSHDLGIALITYGFGVLSVVAAVLLVRVREAGRAAGMRTLAAMSLFLLAASFVHFGAEHGPGSWAHELLFHHAGVPVALFILLQDYRFLLLDVFIRLLGAAVLAGVFAAALLVFGGELGLFHIEEASELGLAAFLILTSAAILAFPWLLDRLRPWVQSALFRRGDVRTTAAAIRSLGEVGREEAYLREATQIVARFAGSKRWDLVPAAPEGRTARSRPLQREGFPTAPWAEAAVPLRLGGQARRILLGPREGARRYLSEDIADLDLLAAEVAARAEELRLEEQRRLLAEAELETLRAQINPHFLFNALNAIYGIIPRSASDARKSVVNLADIFRYALEGKRQMVTLEEELRIVDSYLQIERLRLGDRLRTNVEADPDTWSIKTPALSLQPLVENAVKHGVSAKPEGGMVSVDARLRDRTLVIEVHDNGGGFDPDSARPGHGLRNVERRLSLCYGDDALFTIESSPAGTEVRLEIPDEPRRS